MSTMLITFNGTLETGQFLGDTLCSIKTAYLFAQNHPCSKYLLTLSPRGKLNFLWQKFIDTYHVEVIYDTFEIGDMEQRFRSWNKWRKDRSIEGRPFDHYRELYRRIDGGRRQGLLCGSEQGLGRKNIFEYTYYGQEDARSPCVGGDYYGNDMIYYDLVVPEKRVFIAPYAKCQGNEVFSFKYWNDVVRGLVANGIPVTVNLNSEFCNDLEGHPLFRKIYPTFKDLVQEVLKHRLVSCGNTGVGWVAAATGTPLLGMQPPDSNMQDYRYEWCGVKSLVEFLEFPDVDYCVKRITEELEKEVVLTTGCYDILHAGHIRHLQESRSLGTKLVVALNSDSSVKLLKGDDRPVHNQDDRATVLKALGCVDEVRIFDGENALSLIQDIRPMVITNGSDHKEEEIVGKSYVEKYGGRVVVTSGNRTISTTQAINKLKDPTISLMRVINDAARFTPNPSSKLKRMLDEFISVRNLSGAIADLGSYRGGCALVLRSAAPDKHLYLFDTWEGNPYHDPMCHHKKGEWSADLAEVKANVGVNHLTHYMKGIFPETAKVLEGNQFSFVMVDPDTYQTTKDAIEWFYPRLVPGGKLFFDDYDWEPCAGVKKAVDESFPPEVRKVHKESFSCVIVK